MKSTSIRSSLPSIMEPILRSKRKLSVVVGLLEGEQAHVEACGHPLPQSQVPTAALLFELGSVTKLFTGALLADLAREKLLRLDDPVPDLSRPGAPPITLLQLATHTSGLPRLPTNLHLSRASPDDPYAHYTVEDLKQFVARYEPKRGHMPRFSYSNAGMGLLGHLLQEKLGMSYEEAVLTRICRPLGMEDTRITLTPEQEQRRVQGHSARGRPVSPWRFPALPGAGALRSTAGDMLKFLAANLGHAPPGLQETLRMCHAPQAPAGKGRQVGLGWLLRERRGQIVLLHNGATGGATSFVGLVKERQLGVVVLANQGPSFWAALGLTADPATRLGLALVERFLSA